MAMKSAVVVWQAGSRAMEGWCLMWHLMSHLKGWQGQRGHVSDVSSAVWVWGWDCEQLSLLSTHTSPPSVMCPPSTFASRASTLAWLRRGRNSGSRLDLSYKGELLHSAMRTVQSPGIPNSSRRQEVNERRGSGSLPAADGVAVRQGVLHCQLPPEALQSSPIFAPTHTAPSGGRRELGRGGRVAKLVGVGRDRGEGACSSCPKLTHKWKPIYHTFLIFYTIPVHPPKLHSLRQNRGGAARWKNYRKWPYFIQQPEFRTFQDSFINI
jgi:hypothetical protein